jgi:hypothetical protein
MDDLFTTLNPGYWPNRSRWPPECLQTDFSQGKVHPWVFLLEAVDQVGRKQWGDRWRAPPFVPDDAAARSRFMRTIVWMQPRCACTSLCTALEVVESTGPEPDTGDDIASRMECLPYERWFAPGWEWFFLLGLVRTNNGVGQWLYVRKSDLDKYIAHLQPQQDEPAPSGAVEVKEAAESGRARRLGSKTAAEFVSEFLKRAATPTITGLEEAAKAAGIVGGRELIRGEYRRQMALRTGQPAKQGRRPNLPKQSAEK